MPSNSPASMLKMSSNSPATGWFVSDPKTSDGESMLTSLDTFGAEADAILTSASKATFQSATAWIAAKSSSKNPDMGSMLLCSSSAMVWVGVG